MIGLKKLYIIIAMLLPSLAFASEGQPKVEIVINSTTTSVNHDVITIADIATVRGGSRTLRQAIEKLDLDEVKANDSRSIDQKHIEYRIRLSQIPKDKFVVHPGQTVVHRRSPGMAPMVGAESNIDPLGGILAEKVAEQFLLDPNDVLVVIEDYSKRLVASRGIQVATNEIEVSFGTNLPIGKRTFQVSFRDIQGQMTQVALRATTSIRMNVAMANRHLPRGTKIAATDIKTMARFVSHRSHIPADANRVIGSYVSRDIPPLSVIPTTSIRQESLVKTTVAVKRNQLVNAVLQRGRLVIEVKNVVCQSKGKVGETIEILNPFTEKRMLATVIDGFTVKIR